MGKRGPHTAPTPIKKLRGDRAARIAKAEVQPPAGAVSPPAGLDEKALAVWVRYAASLHRAGLLNQWDADLFATFCRAVVNVEEAYADVVARGQVLEAANGNRYRNPSSVIVRDATATMVRLAAHFGLTPSARAELGMRGVGGNAETESDSDDILSA